MLHLESLHRKLEIFPETIAYLKAADLSHNVESSSDAWKTRSDPNSQKKTKLRNSQ